MVVRYTFSSSAHIFDILVNRYEIKMLSADDLHTSSVAINKTQYTNAWTRIESNRRWVLLLLLRWMCNQSSNQVRYHYQYNHNYTYIDSRRSCSSRSGSSCNHNESWGRVEFIRTITTPLPQFCCKFFSPAFIILLFIDTNSFTHHDHDQ